jgi:hypothetical protein
MIMMNNNSKSKNNNLAQILNSDRWRMEVLNSSIQIVLFKTKIMEEAKVNQEKPI